MTPPNPFENGPFTPGKGSTRRRFIKESSAIGVGSVIGASLLPSSVYADDSNETHCDLHGSSCVWIKKIDITFNSTANPTDPNYNASGRIFIGTMLVTVFGCQEAPHAKRGERTLNLPIHSGGYLDSTSAVNQNDDTCSPGGNRQLIDPKPSGTTNGYLIDTSDTQRTLIKIHYQIITTGGSHGCLVAQPPTSGPNLWNGNNGDNFVEWIKGNVPKSGKSCTHSPGPPNPIPVNITYSTNPVPSGHHGSGNP